jgi:hypothetical protein
MATMAAMMVFRMLLLILSECLLLVSVLRERVRMTDVVLPIRRASGMAPASAMAPSSAMASAATSAGECLRSRIARG